MTENRPHRLYSRTFAATTAAQADTDANDYGDLVSDMGGNVEDIRPYASTPNVHYRVVIYRADRRIQEDV